MPNPDIPKIDGLNEHQVATLVYCRSYKQYCSMLEGYRAGKCPFCELDPEKNKVICMAGMVSDPLAEQSPIVYKVGVVTDPQRAVWRMWVNPFPLAHTSVHLVMAPTRHVAPGEDITPHDFEMMGKLFQWAQNEYKFTGGGFAMRFGSPLQSSGTVLHLHANVIIPDQTGGVEVTLSKEPEKVAEQVARMQVFMRLYAGATSTDLTPDEQKLIEGRLK